MVDIFRWGIIGPGKIAHKFAQCLQGVKNVRLQAVASTNSKRAQDFKDQYHAQKAYSSYEDLLNDIQVDAVYIATTHNFHYENIKLCLQAGKPVLCEKPLTVNAKEAQKLIELARKKGVFLMEALWTRFLPSYQQVRRWLEKGTLGDIRLLESTFGFILPKDPLYHLFNPDLAGGVLLDLGVYPIAISQWVLGENPIAFEAISHFSETGVDDLTCVTLQYKREAFSQFSCNILMRNRNDFVIYGTKGAICIHPCYWEANCVTLKLPQKKETLTFPFRANGFEYEVEEVMRCVQAGELESKVMTLTDTLANMTLMDAIRKKIRLVYPFEKEKMR